MTKLRSPFFAKPHLRRAAAATAICSLAIAVVTVVGAQTINQSGPAVAAEQQAQRENAPVGEMMLQGLAMPWREANLRVDGRQVIAAVHVGEGDYVKKGQSLLEFDRRSSSQQLRVAEAAEGGAAALLRQAELELQLAQYRRAQLRGAHEAGASTDAEFHESQVRAQQSGAALESAKQALAEAIAHRKLAEVEDERRQLVAPFPGVIMRIDAVPGELNDGASTLMVLADLSRLRTELPLPASQLKHFTQGEQWQLEAGAPVQATISARLIAVEPRVNPITQTVRGVLEIDNSSGFPAGFSVRLRTKDSRP